MSYGGILDVALLFAESIIIYLEGFFIIIDSFTKTYIVSSSDFIEIFRGSLNYSFIAMNLLLFK